MVEMDDLISYEIAMEKRDDAYLVTGNYSIRAFIVTPTEMMEIIVKGKRGGKCLPPQ